MVRDDLERSRELCQVRRDWVKGQAKRVVKLTLNE